mgnify:FL=1
MKYYKLYQGKYKIGLIKKISLLFFKKIIKLLVNISISINFIKGLISYIYKKD